MQERNPRDVKKERSPSPSSFVQQTKESDWKDEETSNRSRSPAHQDSDNSEDNSDDVGRKEVATTHRFGACVVFLSHLIRLSAIYLLLLLF